MQQIQRLRDKNNPTGMWLIAAIAGMAGLMAQGLFDTVWYRPQVNTLWWFMVALIASQYQPKAPVKDVKNEKIEVGV